MNTRLEEAAQVVVHAADCERALDDCDTCADLTRRADALGGDAGSFDVAISDLRAALLDEYAGEPEVIGPTGMTYRIKSISVRNGVATLPNGQTVRSTADSVRVPIPTCQACGADLEPGETHFSLFAGVAGEYICPVVPA